MLPWLLAAALAGCSPDDPAPTATDLADGRINTTVYDCAPGGRAPFEFTIRRGAAELALWLPPEFERPYLVLSEEHIGSEFTGLYREADVSLDLADATVELGVGDARFTGCRENRLRSVWEHAKLSGVDFRATGENPAWYLEIRDAGHIEFRSALDSEPLRLTSSQFARAVSADGATYLSTDGAAALTAEISRTACTVVDGLGLSGSTVIVIATGMQFTGCGRSLH